MDPFIRLFWEGRTTESWFDPRRRIYDCELVYVSGGAFRIELEGAEYTLRAGDIVIVPPDFLHESWVDPGGFTVRHCIHFGWSRETAGKKSPMWAVEGEPFKRALVHPIPRQFAARFPLISRMPQHREMFGVLELALRHLRAGDWMGELLLWPLLRFLLRNRSDAQSAPAAARSTQALFALKQFIDANYAREIGYADFCRTTRLTRAHLCSAFQRLLGRPPMAYLNDVRLHHAQRLLKQPATSIKAAAHAVGIHDTNYFARLFRKRVGTTPTEFAAR